MSQSDLRQEVSDTIKPWRTVKPPVSVADLVLAAFLAAGDDGLTQAEAAQWIYDHFEYYREIGISSMGTLTVGEVTLPSPSLFHRFRTEISQVFSVHGAPTWATSETRDTIRVWKCDMSSTAYIWRQHSRRYDEKSVSMPFRFLDLPSEMRNTIYDLVFQYPASGVGLGRARSCRIRQWCPDLPFSFEDWDNHKAWVPLTRQSDPFALLRVCRQIYLEASTSFLATNLIYIRNPYELRGFREAINKKELQRVTRIAISYSSWSEDIEPGLIWLQNLPKLGELHLYVSERGRRPYRRSLWASRSFDEPMNVVFCRRIATLLSKLPCADNIDIQGDCPKLRAALAKVAAEPRASGGSSKRGKTNHKRAKQSPQVAKKNRCKFCDCRLRQYLTRSGGVKYNCTGSVHCPGRRAVR